MSRGVELFIRMHLEKTPSQQRGRQTLTGDVIVAVLGKLQHDFPFGSDAIMWKWLGDDNAVRRLTERMGSLMPANAKRPDLCCHMIALALSVFAGKPVSTQQRQLVSLWKKHSEQARRSERLIRTWQTQIKVLERELYGVKDGMTTFRAEQLLADIEKKQALIANEQERLTKYAKAQAEKSCQCPRCHGTGVAKIVNQCPSCGGEGALTVTPDNVRQHLRQQGIARVSDALWTGELKPLFERAVNELHCQHNAAAAALAKQLRLEKDAA